MNRIATIDEIIKHLGPRDSRQDWWIDVKNLINNGDYSWALMKLRSHDYDDDYCEQCATIGQAIAEHWKNLGEDRPAAIIKSGEEPLAIIGQGSSQTKIMP